jgi:hypothetical protein
MDGGRVADQIHRSPIASRASGRNGAVAFNRDGRVTSSRWHIVDDFNWFGTAEHGTRSLFTHPTKSLV